MTSGIFSSTLVPPGQIQGKIDRIKWSDEVVKESLLQF